MGIFFLAFSNLKTEAQSGLINIENDAYTEFRQNGGTVQQWQNYSTEIIDRYKRKYYSNSQTPKTTSDAIKELNSLQSQIDMNRSGLNLRQNYSYIQGTISGSNGQIGSYNNGYVLNSMGQTLGYLNQGRFMNINQQCIGFVNGTQILSCNGNLIATVSNNSVYNSQGYLLYNIDGDQLFYQNYVKAKISGLDIMSLAAYLLFFN